MNPEYLFTLAELSRRFSHIIQHGTVTEVHDGQHAVVKLEIDGQDILTPSMPVLTRAVEVNEPVLLLCDQGDLAQAVALPFQPDPELDTLQENLQQALQAQQNLITQMQASISSLQSQLGQLQSQVDSHA